MSIKTFQSEFFRFNELLKEQNNFTLTRFGDGEMTILFNQFADFTGKFNGEWIHDPNNEHHQFFREKLINAFQYKGENYYLGIVPPSLVGWEKHNKIREMSGQDEEMLTFCTIYMRSNYDLFLKHTYPLFKNYKTIGIFHNNANFNKLDFKFEKIFNVGINAWINNYYLTDEIPKYIKENKIKNHLFLFAAGPLAPILIKECHMIEPENIYINIGSTMDLLVGLGGTRHYLRGEANEKTNMDDWHGDKMLSL